MTDMREPGLRNTQLPDLLDGLGQRKMGKVFFMPEGVEYHLLAAPDLLAFTLFDAVGIRDIREVAKAETEDRHLHMPDQDGDDRNVADGKRVFIDPDKPQVGDPGVLHIRKGIREFPYDRLLRHFIGKKIHGFVLKEVIRPDIIQPRQMILMGMGKDDGIQLSYLLPQHLVAEVGCGVDDYRRGGGLNKNTAAKSLVPGIG